MIAFSILIWEAVDKQCYIHDEAQTRSIYDLKVITTSTKNNLVVIYNYVIWTLAIEFIYIKHNFKKEWYSNPVSNSYFTKYYISQYTELFDSKNLKKINVRTVEKMWKVIKLDI